MSKLILKRDEESTGHPAPEQLEVGELLFNALTGKLYSKVKNGDVIEFIGQKVCFTTLPTVQFYYENENTGDLIDNFCCSGGLLSIIVDKLRPDPSNYTFSVVELTNNTTTDRIVLDDPEFTVYTQNSVTYKKATIPTTISVNPSAYNNISLFKLNIFLDSVKIFELIFTIQCLESNT